MGRGVTKGAQGLHLATCHENGEGKKTPRRQSLCSWAECAGGVVQGSGGHTEELTTPLSIDPAPCLLPGLDPVPSGPNGVKGFSNISVGPVPLIDNCRL